MKKLFSLLLVTLMALALVAGCGSDAAPEDEENGAPEQSETTNVYNNGTFEGYSNYSRGYVKASVTINEDEITNVEIVEFNGDGIEKDYETYGNDDFPVGLLEDAHTTLAADIVEANGVDVDDFTGATSTSTKVKEAVAQALEKALVEKEEGLIDGTYFARSEIGERGYSAALVTISGGVITEVELWDTQGNLEDGFTVKPDDYDYTQYFDAMEQVSNDMVEANSYDVDTYAEATGSSEKWIEAVKQVLEMATR